MKKVEPRIMALNVAGFVPHIGGVTQMLAGAEVGRCE